MRRWVLACLLLSACATSPHGPGASSRDEALPLATLIHEEHDDPLAALAGWVALLRGSRDESEQSLAIERIDSLVADGVVVDGAAALAVADARLTVETRRMLGLARARVARMSHAEDEAQRFEREVGCALPWRAGAPVARLARAHLDRSPVAADFSDGVGSAERIRGCNVLAVTPDGRPGAIPIGVDLEADASSELSLHVGSDQPSRVWLDGVPGPAADRRESPLRVHRYRLRVPAGKHRIVVVAAAPYGRTEVTLTLAALDSHIRGYEQPIAQRYTQTEDRTVSALPASPLRDADGKSTWRAYLAVTDAARWGDSAAATIASERLLGLAPKLAPALALVARIVAENPGVPQRIARDRARRLLERALSADPDAARVRAELIRLALGRERARDALDLVVSEHDAHSARLVVATTEVLRARGRDPEVRAVLDRLTGAAKNACSVVEARVADDRWRHRPVDEALVKRITACRPGSIASAELARQRGALDEAVEALRRATKADPINETPRVQLGEVLMEAGRLEEAVATYRQLVHVAQRSTSYRLRLVDALVAAGNLDDAQRALREGLALDPDNAELAATARSLARARGADLNPTDPDRIDGRAAITAFEKSGHRYDGAAVFVLDRAVTRVYENGARRNITHNIVKVLAKEGIDRWGEWQIPAGAELLTLRAWKPDGSQLEPEEVAEKESISLPGLDVGDYVEVEYIERAPPPAAFPGGFLGERFYFGSFDAPLDRSEYELVSPQGMKVEVDRRGTPPDMSVSTRDERDGPVDVRRFEAHEMSQREAEPSSVPPVEFVSSVRLSLGVSQAAWRDFLVDFSWSARRRDPEISRLAKSLIVGARTDREKVTRIERWVRGNIKRSDSLEEAASATLARREGSRVTLIAALSEAVGVPARVLLARSQRSPNISSELEGFDQALVEAGGMVIDPRYRHGHTGDLPPPLRGAQALVLESEASATPVTLPTTSPDQRRMHVDLTLSADGGGQVVVEEVLEGWPAVEWRDSLAQLAPDRVRPQFEQRTLAYFFPGATLTSLTWEAAEVDDRPFIVRYALTAPGMIRRVGDAWVLPVPFAAQLLRRYATGAPRQTPILLDEVAPTELTLRLHLPTGARLHPATPVEVAVGDARFAQRLDEKTLVLQSRFGAPGRRIPVAEVPAFLKWSEQVDRAEAAAAHIVIP